MKKSRFIMLALFILIGGCSNGDDKTTIEQSSKEQSSKEPIFNDQLKALEKAKDVEQVIQMGMDKRIEALDEEIR